MSRDRQHRRGRSSGPAMSAHLRRAFELCEAQEDAPQLAKLEAVRVEGQDAHAFVERIQNWSPLDKAIGQAIEILSQISGNSKLADSPEELEGAKMIVAQLVLAADHHDNEFRAWKGFFNAIASLAALEGFILGVAYRQERAAADRQAAQQRPRR